MLIWFDRTSFDHTHIPTPSVYVSMPSIIIKLLQSFSQSPFIPYLLPVSLMTWSIETEIDFLRRFMSTQCYIVSPANCIARTNSSRVNNLSVLYICVYHENNCLLAGIFLEPTQSSGANNPSFHLTHSAKTFWSAKSSFWISYIRLYSSLKLDHHSLCSN